MNSVPQITHGPELYIRLDLAEVGHTTVQGIEALAATLSPASILLRLSGDDARTQINAIKTCAPPLQARGIAVLIESTLDDALSIAVRGGADGLHSSLPAAIATLHGQARGERIIGAGNLPSRHDAMDAAEAGADYVMFGEPRPDGSLPPLSSVIDRAQWWAEIFETPCVAYAPDLRAVGLLAATGIEFVAVGDWAVAAAHDLAQALAEARAARLARLRAPA